MLLLVVVIRAVDLLFVIADEGHIDHVLLADHAGEALRMVRGPRDPDHLAGDLVVAAWAPLALGPMAGLAEELVVQGVVRAGGSLAALAAFLGDLL